MFKYDFSTNEARNNCNTSFSCNFDCISEIILIIQGHLQGVIEHDELLRVFSFTQPTTIYKNQPKIAKIIRAMIPPASVPTCDLYDPNPEPDRRGMDGFQSDHDTDIITFTLVGPNPTVNSHSP